MTGRIINENNQGSAKTRNIGIEAAGGEYITFLDDVKGYIRFYDTDQIRKIVVKQVD